MQHGVSWKRRLFESSLFLHRFIARNFMSPVHQHDVFVVRKRPDLQSQDPREAAVELAAREIYRYGIEGSVAELGVNTGLFARVINHCFPDRKLYLFDTFEGFDKRDAEVDRKENFSSATQDFTQTSVDLVLSNMEHPENCIIRKGWFPDTSEGIDEKFCFVNLDADLYQPMKAGLEFFYPRLVHGGVIMLHDFSNADPQFDYKGVRKAVKDFCDKNNIGYMCLSDLGGSAVIVK